MENMEVETGIYGRGRTLETLEDYLFEDPSEAFFASEENDGRKKCRGSASSPCNEDADARKWWQKYASKQEKAAPSGCSRTLSRTSSLMSFESFQSPHSSSTGISFSTSDGHTKAALCSPLSRLRRSSSPSFESLESDELDNFPSLSTSDVAVQSQEQYPSVNSSAAHGQLSMIPNSDLSSLMESMLSPNDDLTLPCVDNYGQINCWNLSLGVNPDGNGCDEFLISSPNSPLDFGESARFGINFDHDMDEAPGGCQRKILRLKQSANQSYVSLGNLQPTLQRTSSDSAALKRELAKNQSYVSLANLQPTLQRSNSDSQLSDEEEESESSDVNDSVVHSQDHVQPMAEERTNFVLQANETEISNVNSHSPSPVQPMLENLSTLVPEITEMDKDCDLSNVNGYSNGRLKRTRSGSQLHLKEGNNHLPPHVPFENCHSLGSSISSLDSSGSGLEAYAVPQLGIQSEDDLKGIRLVHLLIAGAEAVSNSNVDLATTIFARLNDLVSRTGSSMQRVGAYFSDALQSRNERESVPESVFEPQNESLSAFQVLHEVTPYIKFGHFTANQAILEAFEKEKRVHIIDFDILEGIQWPSLMQSLACRSGGSPYLRISALCRPRMRRSLAMTMETGKRLSEFATNFKIPFAFHVVRIDDEEDVHPSMLRQVRGECLAVNCMVHMPHMSYKSNKAVTSFLKAVKRMTPKVVTLVAEELSCSSPKFTSHFFDALHHYSAIFDSLDVTLNGQSKGRQLVERMFLAPRIMSMMTSVNSGGPDSIQSENESSIQWHSLAQAAGFHPVPLSVYNQCQAKLLLGLFNDGFKLEENNLRLLLSWRAKALMGASVWHS